MRIAIVVALAVLAVSAPAHADRAWNRRYLHLAIAGVGAAGYVITELPLKADLAPARCRWCDPPGFDVSVRDALVWSDVGRARSLSSLTGFALTPVAMLGLVWASSGHDRSAARWVDDTLPLLEATVAFDLLNQAGKLAVGRERPFVHYADPSRPHDKDDDLSFFSGHTGTAFALATAAGVVAHRRHARLEPVIWATGMTLAATTGYLRIAGDKHWASDVVVGAVLGAGVGLALPLLDRHDLAVTPRPDGLAIAGVF